MDRTQWVVGGSLLLFVVVLLLLCYDCQIGLRQEKGKKNKSKSEDFPQLCGWHVAKILR